MADNGNMNLVKKIMIDYAESTGLTSHNHQNRYLWTDAFAVCNFLELYKHTNENFYRQLALRLVEDVHNVLGKHREDDERSGWISGLDEESGKEHPTVGGLRIGKELNERKQDEEYNQKLEWDRDGQYYHYLTKWMHALNVIGEQLGDKKFHAYAVELAKAAFEKFTYTPEADGRKRMYWKMSIDLSFPLVPSMGQHDPLDGYVTYLEIDNSSQRKGKLLLENETYDLLKILETSSLATNDPLGIGSLLTEAYRLMQMLITDKSDNFQLFERLLESAADSLESFSKQNTLDLPIEYRLAFREIGLAIGLAAVDKMNRLFDDNEDKFSKGKRIQKKLDKLTEYIPLKDKIEEFWSDQNNWKTNSWLAHKEINMVMLVTSLKPDTYLSI